MIGGHANGFGQNGWMSRYSRSKSFQFLVKPHGLTRRHEVAKGRDCRAWVRRLAEPTEPAEIHGLGGVPGTSAIVETASAENTTCGTTNEVAMAREPSMMIPTQTK